MRRLSDALKVFAAALAACPDALVQKVTELFYACVDAHHAAREQWLKLPSGQPPVIDLTAMMNVLPQGMSYAGIAVQQGVSNDIALRGAEWASEHLVQAIKNFVPQFAESPFPAPPAAPSLQTSQLVASAIAQQQLAGIGQQLATVAPPSAPSADLQQVIAAAIAKHEADKAAAAPTA